MRLLSISAAGVAFTAMALATTTADTLGQPVKIYGVNYDTQQCRSDAELDGDLDAIAQIAQSVRVTGLNLDPACPVTRLLTKAKAKGLKVALGMSVDANTTLDAQLDNLLTVITAGAIDSNVVGFHVGSGAIERKEYSATVAVGYLTAVRNLFQTNGVGVKLTIADGVDAYSRYPMLLDAVDYVSINHFSFYQEAMSVGDAVGRMLARINKLRSQAAAANEDFIISETGWASEDPQHPRTLASIANQKQFFQEFYHQATAQDLPYYWSNAFDTTWKGTQYVREYFGIMTGDRVMKPSFTALHLTLRPITTIQSVRGGFLAQFLGDGGPLNAPQTLIAQPSTDKVEMLQYQWFFDAQKSQFRSLNGNQCLTDGSRPSPCRDEDLVQKWTYNAVTFQLQNKYSGQCLELENTFFIKRSACDRDNENQRWGMNGASPVKESVYTRFFTKEASVKAAGGFAQLVRTGSGDAVGVAYSAAGAAGSEWTYDAATKLMRARGTTQCLDAYEAKDGGRVHLWECNPQEKNQLWNLDLATGQFKHVTHADFCLDADLSGNNGQGLVQLWGCHLNNNNQVWRPVVASAKSVRITNKKDASVVELMTQDFLVGKPLTNVDAQSWFWNPFKGTLVSKWNGECLDAYEPREDGRVHTWGCTENEGNQKWTVEDGLIKHAKHTGFCLAYVTGSNKQLVLWSCSATDSTQAFSLVEIK